MTDNNAMRLVRDTLIIPGLSRTYRILHISDSHMSPDSPLDSEEMREKAAKHREVWMAHGNGLTQDANFDYFVEVAKNERVDLSVLCGDMTDFPSVGTADEGAKRYARLGNYLYVPGNHEQGIRFPSYYEAATRGNPALQVVESDELVFVGVDNGCHTVSDEVMDALEALVHGDKPVILVHHIPVDCDTLHPAAVDYWEDVTYFLFGLSGNGENIDRYNRLVRQDRTQLRAVFAGHLHFEHVDRFENGVVQYVAAPCLAGYGQLIEIHGSTESPLTKG